MESIEVQIINPGAVKLLQQLAALNLIVIAKKKKIKLTGARVSEALTCQPDERV